MVVTQQHLKRIQRLAGLLLAVWVAGCQLVPSSRGSASVAPGLHQPASAFALQQGSATQWNSTYAVTAGHIPAISGTTYRCSSECDLVFFPHPAAGPVPAWRHPRTGERLTAVGIAPGNVVQTSEGTARRTRLDISDDRSGVLYGIHDGPVVKGMSGGPVYGEDGSIVGITIGFIPNTEPLKQASPELQATERISIYLPYAEIQSEWVRFQRQRHAEGVADF
ncbi:trypsin-like peptidase domain-containing protein [Geopseudomonas aromaticivorans]